MYLCEVAIVSQLCIFFPYVLHGLCEDYLTCDIAFNAVMPPSRASTRGRYSRIEGVTHICRINIVFVVFELLCSTNRFRIGSISFFALQSDPVTSVNRDGSLVTRHLELQIYITGSCHEFGISRPTKQGMVWALNLHHLKRQHF